MTEEDFNAWLKEARPGSVYTYATASCLAHAHPKSQRVATLALEAYYAGRVELVQRRKPHSNGSSGNGTFAHLAIKRHKVVPLLKPYWLNTRISRIRELVT